MHTSEPPHTNTSPISLCYTAYSSLLPVCPPLTAHDVAVSVFDLVFLQLEVGHGMLGGVVLDALREAGGKGGGQGEGAGEGEEEMIHTVIGALIKV